MNEITFSWDPEKDQLNFKKHGIHFEEAKTVFYDEHARLIDDPDHSENEDRFIMLGFSDVAHLLVVCHCYKEESGGIRIISARKATKKESHFYKEGKIS